MFNPATRPEARGRAQASPLLIYTAILLGASALVLSLVAMLAPSSRMKVGYVRSGELVYGYLGMKEAQQRFEQKKQQWQAEIDTLQTDFRQALHAYNTEAGSLSGTEREKREEFLGRQEGNVAQYTEAIGAKAREEEQKMTQGVLNQINSVAEEYGRAHGFDLVLGTTQSGSILYGDDAIDITEELLEILNQSYKPGATDAKAE